jgi:hypothetical protein
VLPRFWINTTCGGPLWQQACQVQRSAVSRLIYKIGLELKKNPDSGPDYQHLLVELESLDRALKQLQCIRPAHHKLRRLEGIRALASTYQRPLEEFLAEIEKFEEHLGPWGAKCNRLSGFGRRLQWSTRYKEDVKELRAKLAPNIATITILLMTQTLDTLSKAESDRLEIARDLKQTVLNIATTQARLEAGQTGLTAKTAGQDQELCSLHAKADELLKNDNTHKLHLHDQDNILVDIRENAIPSMPTLGKPVQSYLRSIKVSRKRKRQLGLF